MLKKAPNCKRKCGHPQWVPTVLAAFRGHFQSLFAGLCFWMFWGPEYSWFRNPGQAFVCSPHPQGMQESSRVLWAEVPATLCAWHGSLGLCVQDRQTGMRDIFLLPCADWRPCSSGVMVFQGKKLPTTYYLLPTTYYLPAISY